jgi:hypothetical protein
VAMDRVVERLKVVETIEAGELDEMIRAQPAASSAAADRAQEVG